MKFALTFLALSLLLLGCHKQSDAKVRGNLPGTWLFEQDYASGNKYESTTMVSSNGGYICHITAHGNSNQLWTYTLEGIWQIKNGFLIDTVTKHSQTNAKLPIITRSKIIRADGQELVIKSEFNQLALPNLRDVIFRKQTN